MKKKKSHLPQADGSSSFGLYVNECDNLCCDGKAFLCNIERMVSNSLKIGNHLRIKDAHINRTGSCSHSL